MQVKVKVLRLDARYVGAVSIWNVGECFTCTKCLLRSAWRKCPRCGGHTVDLRVESLEGKWSAWRGFAEGWSLASVSGVRAMKRLRGLAGVLTVGACLAPIAGPWLKKGQPPELMEIGIALVMDALIAWPLFWFFSLYLLLFAHVLRGLAWVTSLGAEISPVGTLRFSVLARLTRVMARADSAARSEERGEPRRCVSAWGDDGSGDASLRA